MPAHGQIQLRYPFPCDPQSGMLNSMSVNLFMMQSIVTGDVASICILTGG